MKKIVAILMIVFSYVLVNGQGTCSSPDYAMDEIAASPSSYQELEDGGYCRPGTGSTSWHYMCFTFTPDVTAVDINMGNSSNCAVRQFQNFTLYDKDCNVEGTGLSYTGLTANEEYTFCLEMKANGGPSCNGFDRVCPYWIDTSVPLPIELLNFECTENIITWTTGSERNNKGFYLGDTTGAVIAWIEGAGNSNWNIDYYYEVKECVNFLKLIQIDYDGKVTDYNYDNCNCKEENKSNNQPSMNYNLLGQKIR